MNDLGVEGWHERQLEEVADVGAGNPAPQDKKLFEGGRYPFIRTSDVGQIRFGEIESTSDLLNEKGVVGLRLVPAGTILMPKSGASTFLNHRVITRRDAYVSSHLATITAKSGLAEPRYLLYALSRIAAQELLPENSYPSLNLSLIKSIKLPLPPLEEQQRIVAVLDEAFEGLARARAHAEANLQNARELFGSALHVAFKDETISWNNTALATLGSVVTGSTPKTSDQGNLGDHLPFVTPGDFLPDGSLAYDNRGLSEKGASVSRILPTGSALMVCIGATIGKTGYCDRPIATNQQINAVIPNDHISGEYLYYQMLTPEFQAAVMHGSGQATLPIINKGKWSKLTVRVPNDLTKQTHIVNRLSGLRAQIDTTLAQYKAQIMDIADLRQTLLHKAFSGELT
ncbi:restriction endonuclease subunit S [Paracoccus marcusii]|uniref:Restriction endonuclease subunit S n=1 Tax=Paracoccus marcusii TaxID=59779 RepID=A0ABY7UU40_9RHOB|nr:restriction endonuclease subunit S [Paracoccus marcusii]WDA13459.1 restriction endonuclease subunit S [Paracoccus marcusii]